MENIAGRDFGQIYDSTLTLDVLRAWNICKELAQSQPLTHRHHKLISFQSTDDHPFPLSL